MTLDNLNDKEKKSSSKTKDELDILEMGIDIKMDNYFITNIKKLSNDFGIPDNIIKEYLNFIKDDIQGVEDFVAVNNSLKRKLGFSLKEYKDIEINFFTGIFAFYIKKFCPIKYKEITNLILQMGSVWDGNYEDYEIITGDSAEKPFEKIINFIKQHGENLSYKCLRFCSPFKGSYLKKGFLTFPLHGEGEHLGFSMLVQFFENFVKEPESINLLQYLASNPQKLRNLGGKEVKEIDLDTNKGINFAFRGIIEMVKSRPDIDFPHLKENPTNEEKQKWKQQRGIIIKKYEDTLRNYISKDFQKGKNNAETKKTTFDKIFFTTKNGDRIFENFPLSKEGIQNFSGSEILDYSTGWIPETKDSIHNEFGNFINQGILNPSSLFSNKERLNSTGEEFVHMYEGLNPSDQMLFQKGLKKLKMDGYVYEMANGKLIREKENNYILKNPQREVFVSKNGSKMFSDIEKYVKEHPQENVLVCVAQHGDSDGSSGNGWSKEDWSRLASLSPNLKIWSVRCHFGKALDNKDIYGYKSPVSGFSNNSATFAVVNNVINSAMKKGLGFHEMEIYTRLNYMGSVTPLTESMEYKNQKTKKPEIGKIGLAQNDSQNDIDSDVSYA